MTLIIVRYRFEINDIQEDDNGTMTGTHDVCVPSFSQQLPGVRGKGRGRGRAKPKVTADMKQKMTHRSVVYPVDVMRKDNKEWVTSCPQDSRHTTGRRPVHEIIAELEKWLARKEPPETVPLIDGILVEGGKVCDFTKERIISEEKGCKAVFEALKYAGVKESGTGGNLFVAYMTPESGKIFIYEQKNPHYCESKYGKPKRFLGGEYVERRQGFENQSVRESGNQSVGDLEADVPPHLREADS